MATDNDSNWDELLADCEKVIEHSRAEKQRRAELKAQTQEAAEAARRAREECRELLAEAKRLLNWKCAS